MIRKHCSISPLTKVYQGGSFKIAKILQFFWMKRQHFELTKLNKRFSAEWNHIHLDFLVFETCEWWLKMFHKCLMYKLIVRMTRMNIINFFFKTTKLTFNWIFLPNWLEQFWLVSRVLSLLQRHFNWVGAPREQTLMI